MKRARIASASPSREVSSHYHMVDIYFLISFLEIRSFAFFLEDKRNELVHMRRRGQINISFLKYISEEFHSFQGRATLKKCLNYLNSKYRLVAMVVSPLLGDYFRRTWPKHLQCAFLLLCLSPICLDFLYSSYRRYELWCSAFLQQRIAPLCNLCRTACDLDLR